MIVTRIQWIVITLFVFAATIVEAQESYKVVLASFKTFKEAKSVLEELKPHLDAEDERLKEECGFEYVARPSGKAFLVGIEPIGSKEEAQKILKHYKRSYADAYINKYYGPTEGSYFLSATETPSSLPTVPPVAENEEPTQTDAPAVAPEPAPKPVIKTVPKVPSEDNGLTYYLLFGLLVVFIGMGYGMLRQRRTIAALKEQLLRLSVVDAFQEPEFKIRTMQEETPVSQEREDTIQHDSPEEPVSGNDPFYQLIKNISFRTLIQELQYASDNKEAKQCRDLMDEIKRYQKNYRHSAVLERMDALIDAKTFDVLSAIIRREAE